MAVPLAIAGAGVGAALGVLSGLSSNAKLTKQANENWNATLTTLGQTRGLSFANLLYQGQEINRAIGMELTNLGQEKRRAAASTAVNTTERNIYGATAARLQGQVEMDAALMADNIIQKGEASMADVQTNLANANYDYNYGVQQASMQRASMLNQRQGTFEILAGAASTAVSFASAGYSVGT